MIFRISAHMILHGRVRFVACEADRTVYAVMPGVDSASPAIFWTSRVDAFVFREMGSCSGGGRSNFSSFFLSFHRQHFRFQVVDPLFQVCNDTC